MDGQWNADIITPIDEGSAPIATNGGLKKNEDLELEVSVDNETIVINGEGELQAVGGGGGASYTAGNGIEIENNQISVDTDVVATKSDLPDMSDYATESELTAGLATKQDVIDDLSTIRSGAALGSTAVQPAALNDYATTSALASGLAAKQDTISDLSTIRTGASAGATAVQPGDLATVATTGAYADLSGKPSLATVATSGSYDDLSNKPSIPAAQVQTDWDAVSGIASIANKPNLATVATSGSYNDLSDKPTIPAAVTVDQHYDALSANPQSGTAVAEAIAGTGQVPTVTSADDNKVLMASYSGGVGSFAWEPSAAATQVNADWEASSGVAEILHKPDLSVYAQSANLATVATSGDYNDLSNRPTIPAAQVNADWDAVSGVSQILNKPTLATVATSGDYDDLQNKPTIPAAQVQSDWNAVSGVSAIANKPDLSVYATNSDLTSGLAAKQDTISDLSAIRSGASAGATAVQPGDLATVATTGAYTDLSGTPDLSGYATTSAMNTALAGKQASLEETDTIELTGTGNVYPGVRLTTSKSTGENISFLNADTDTQDHTAGISLDFVKVQSELTPYFVSPSDLATVATSGDYDDLSNKPDIPDTKPVVAGSNVTITENANDITISATDTTYSAGTGISISSGTISNSDPLPSHTATESGKVLGVDSNGALGWVNQSGGGSSYVAGTGIDITNDTISVDTTVVATQSDLSNYTPTANLATVATTGDYDDLTGTPATTALVAGTNVTITESANNLTISATDTTYSAGDGIDITSGEISVAYNQNTLDVAATSTTASLSDVMAYGLNFNLPSDVASMISSLMTGGTEVTMTIPSDILINQRGSEDDAFLMFSTSYIPGVNDSVILKAPLAYSERTEEGISLDGQTVTLPVVDSTNWYIGSNVTTSAQFISMAIMFGSADGSSVSIYGGEGFYAESAPLDPPMTFTQMGAPLLTVSNPLPASAVGDAGKVLTVNSSGNAAWATPSVVPTAGNMLSTTNNVLNVTTTAGITDIQIVASLPAQPVATVLYLIQES